MPPKEMAATTGAWILFRSLGATMGKFSTALQLFANLELKVTCVAVFYRNPER